MRSATVAAVAAMRTTGHGDDDEDDDDDNGVGVGGDGGRDDGDGGGIQVPYGISECQIVAPLPTWLAEFGGQLKRGLVESNCPTCVVLFTFPHPYLRTLSVKFCLGRDWE